MSEYIHCNHIWDEEGLSFYARGIYCLLAKFADKQGKCWPSLKTLRDHSKLSKPTIIKAIAELKDNGYVTIDKNKTVNGDFDHNVYVLPRIKRVVNHVDNVVKEIDKVVNVVDQGSKGDLPGVVNHVDPNYIHNNYSIELLGKPKVLNNLIELYKQCSPLNIKEYGIKATIKARDVFEVAISKGTSPEKLAKSIRINQNIPPWEIVKKTEQIINTEPTENELKVKKLMEEMQADGYFNPTPRP